jgi:hypothetical protein
VTTVADLGRTVLADASLRRAHDAARIAVSELRRAGELVDIGGLVDDAQALLSAVAEARIADPSVGGKQLATVSRSLVATTQQAKNRGTVSGFA